MKNICTSLAILYLHCLCYAPGLIAQSKFLSYEQAYENASPQLFQPLPQINGWLDAAHYLEYKSVPKQLLKVNAVAGSSELFVDFNSLNQGLPQGLRLERYIAHSPDWKTLLLSHENDLYSYDIPAKRLQRLTNNKEQEINTRFSPDYKKVAFTRENNLFFIDLASGKETQLTQDGSSLILNGYASWVYYEEILGRASHYAAFWWSPNSEYLAYLRFDDTNVPEFPIYNADGVHGELERQRYPKAGDPNPGVKLGIARISSAKTSWVDINETMEYTAWPYWTPDSKELLFQQMNRDQNKLLIYAADPQSGERREVYMETQPSWVTFFEDIYLFQNGSGMLLNSDKDGWKHIYYYDLQGRLIKKLTEGKWQVKNIAYVDETAKKVYFHADKGASTDNYLFSIGLDGKGMKQLTVEPGTNNCTFSEGGYYFINSHSSITQSPSMHLVSNEGFALRKLGEVKTALLQEYALGKTELFRIPSTDGYNLPAYWILPPDFNEAKKYPIIFSIYGGPDAGTVRNTFRPLSDQFLAQNGIIVFAVDHRCSGHFGKEGVSLMHRNLGKWEMHDWISVVNWLKTKPFIDPDRIAITGGSYGGYSTLLGLTVGAGYFTHGVSRAPVTDWRLYDNVYTERYMDHPDENPDGYKAGSVLTYLDKFKGKLLLMHGTIDDNVHMQNSTQFVDEMIDKGKNFEFMFYPNERHGFTGAKRKHANRLATTFWFRELLKKEVDF